MCMPATRKNISSRKTKSHAMKNPILHGFTKLILYRRDYITCLLHFLCEISDRHSRFFCTRFHGDDPILHQRCICTNLAFSLAFDSALTLTFDSSFSLAFNSALSLPSTRSSFNSSAIKTRNASHMILSLPFHFCTFSM